MYDVIVVGGRVAGSALALRLAREGVRVLILDRSHFPSDTLSTHQLQVAGVSRLAELGVLNRVLSAGTPPTRRVRFQAGRSVIDAAIPRFGEADYMISPRRTVLDACLVEAAREAGAEFREGIAVEELLRDGQRVVGVRAVGRSGGRVSEEHARLVVGADGKRSTVARLVGAREYGARPAATVASYAYWDGFPTQDGEVHTGAGWAASAWPTNDGLTLTYCARPLAEWKTVRRNPEAALLETLDRVEELGERTHQAKRVGSVRSTNDTGATFRQAAGPGWLLAGDAGLVMDPITGLGMSHALRDAELVAAAMATILGGGDERRAGREYGRARDRETKAIYDFTAGLAALRGTTPAEERLFSAIAMDPIAGTRFLAVISGAAPLAELFSPPALVRLVGVRGFLSLARSRPR
ncbi:FAD-dependent oxidoreductase [Micropruina sp.]|uniref:FAD-dependent oxidoreductase n=1 Tax=Micropruina sp. TaxID=2737536 RepID=UPI0039E33CDF